MSIRLDATETLVGSVVGLCAGILANYKLLPLWGFNPSAGDSIAMGLLFFVIGFATRFIIRRVFRVIGGK